MGFAMKSPPSKTRDEILVQHGKILQSLEWLDESWEDLVGCLDELVEVKR